LDQGRISCSITCEVAKARSPLLALSEVRFM
jgi:hypothetical protein